MGDTVAKTPTTAAHRVRPNIRKKIGLPVTVIAGVQDGLQAIVLHGNTNLNRKQ